MIKEDIVCSGGLFLTKKTKRFLFLLRTQGKTAGTWGFVGGKKEPADLTPYDTLTREIYEEVGKTPTIKKMIPLEQYTSSDQHFKYNTYILIVDDEFIPTLNEEHSAYAWCDYNSFPKPLHKGVRSSLNNKSIKSKIELILDLI
jgi:8-oxo-dGTP pyrophosphatase MutT (NUDIX family)